MVDRGEMGGTGVVCVGWKVGGWGGVWVGGGGGGGGQYTIMGENIMLVFSRILMENNILYRYTATRTYMHLDLYI